MTIFPRGVIFFVSIFKYVDIHYLFMSYLRSDQKPFNQKDLTKF